MVAQRQMDRAWQAFHQVRAQTDVLAIPPVHKIAAMKDIRDAFLLDEIRQAVQQLLLMAVVSSQNAKIYMTHKVIKNLCKS